MDFSFNLGWMFGGLVILAIGVLIVVFYRQIAENLASGIRSYDHVKLFGIITIIVGILITTNLHTVLLNLILHLITGR